MDSSIVMRKIQAGCAAWRRDGGGRGTEGVSSDLQPRRRKVTITEIDLGFDGLMVVKRKVGQGTKLDCLRMLQKLTMGRYVIWLTSGKCPSQLHARRLALVDG